jgi:hypothetical protein
MPKRENTQTLLGIFLVIITNALIVIIGGAVAENTYPGIQTYPPYPGMKQNFIFDLAILIVLGISIFQLVYLIPLMFWLRRRQQFALRKGVIIGAVITALANGACYLQFVLPR